LARWTALKGTTLAELILELNPRPLVAGAAQAESALEGVADQANRATSAVGMVGKGMAVSGRAATTSAGALSKLGRTALTSGNSMRMLSMQLSQVGQQTMAGGNFFRALAIQLPDIGLAFGTIGTAIGLVAGIALPGLISALGGGSSAVEGFREDVDELDGAVGQLETTLRQVSDGAVAKLVERYGDLADEVMRAVEAQAMFDLQLANLELKNTIDSLNEMATAWSVGSMLFGGAIGKAASLSKSLGIAGEEARQLVSYFDAMALADGPVEQAQAMERLRDAFVRVVGEGGSLNQEQLEFVKGLNDAIINAYTLAGAGEEVTEAFSRASAEVANLARNISSYTRTSTIIGEDQLFSMPVEIAPVQDRRRSSGRSAVDTLANEYERLRGALDPVWKATRDYEKAVKTLDAALASGLIESQEEYNALLALAAEEFQTTAESARTLQTVADNIQNSMESAFMAMVEGTKTAKEAFRDMALAVVKELYRILVVQQLVGSFDASSGEGSGLVGLIMRGISGAFADGGYAQSGHAYIVGERGPELFVPSRSGTVVPNHEIGGGGGVVVNQTINVSTGVQSTVRAEVIALMPRIAESTKAAVLSEKRRGGAFGKAF